MCVCVNGVNRPFKKSASFPLLHTMQRFIGQQRVIEMQHLSCITQHLEGSMKHTHTDVRSLLQEAKSLHTSASHEISLDT